MNKIELLNSMGYSNEDIKLLLISKKIDLNINDLYINDYDLLMDVIKSTDETFILRHFVDIKVGFKLFELFRLIRLGKYEIAYYLANRIYNEDKIPEVKLIIDNLKYDKDSIEYIIEDDYYDNEELIDKCKNMELDMLLDFYCGNMVEANAKFLQLCNLYVHQNPIPFKALITYLEKIEYLKKNHTKINVRNHQGAIGDPLAVITGLLNQGDYYRAHQVLKTYYLDNVKEFYSVIYEILRLFDVKLMLVLRDNYNNVNKIISLNSNGLNNEHDIVSKYDLSSLDEDRINMMELKEEDIDDNTNYYALYNEHKNKGEYEEAKKAIIKYQYRLNKRDFTINFDYLVYELDVLSYNKKNTPNDQLEKSKKLVEQGDEYSYDSEYDKAIKEYISSFKYEAKKTPKTLSKIAECYMKQGKYLDAYMTYKLEEQEFLYPDDYLYLVECLYRLGLSDKSDYYISKYEDYYDLSSPLIHYIQSLIHLKNEEYAKALDEIGTCEIISMEETGLPLNYCYERNIINALMNGKKVKPYTIDNYYDHCYNDEELNRIFSLDIESYKEGELIEIIKIHDYHESLEERIDYLLRLYKVLRELDRRQDAKDLLIYLQELINNPEISETDKKNFTLVLKNYRSL